LLSAVFQPITGRRLVVSNVLATGSARKQKVQKVLEEQKKSFSNFSFKIAI